MTFGADREAMFRGESRSLAPQAVGRTLGRIFANHDISEEQAEVDFAFGALRLGRGLIRLAAIRGGPPSRPE